MNSRESCNQLNISKKKVTLNNKEIGRSKRLCNLPRDTVKAS